MPVHTSSLLSPLLALLLVSAGVVAAPCDFDDDGRLDAHRDGQLLLRHQHGLRGPALLGPRQALGAGAVEERIALLSGRLDIDADGSAAAATDGRLFIRYLLGYRGPALSEDAVAATGRQRSPLGIAAYLDWLCSGNSSLPGLIWAVHPADGNWGETAWQ